MKKRGRSHWNIKDIFIWLVIFIVGSLIVSFLLNPDSFNNFKSNIRDISTPSYNPDTSSSVKQGSYITNQEDSLISQCKNSFNECRKISETKIDAISLSIIDIKKFTDVNESTEFYRTWSMMNIPIDSMTLIQTLGLISMSDLYYNGVKLEEILPYVLIAVKIRINTQESMSYTHVVACDKNGMLTGYSKQILSC